jgi:hypothetical protein
MRSSQRFTFSQQRSRALLLPLALMAVVVILQSASATEIGLDTVLVFNPTPIAADAFNNDFFDAPPWVVVTGAPGPESGETLEMHDGDTIFIPLNSNREVDLTAYSHVLLTDFPAGSFVSMILFGPENKSISISMAPGAAFLVDETGAILGSAVLPPSSDANLQLTLIPHGPGLLGVTSSIHDVMFTNELKVEFGTVTGLAINVVPEPATLGLLGLGCLIMGYRRRLLRGRE